MPAEGAPRRRWRRFAWGGTAVVIALVLAGDLYVLRTTRDAVAPELSQTPARPYAIVLGNQVSPSGVPSRELAARLERGRQLYRAGLARRIIVSGLVAEGYDEPDTMAAWLESRGVAPADVVIDRGGYRTAASMADARAMGVDSLLVVSQAYHLPRAIYFARHAGMSAVGVPAADVRGRSMHAVVMFFREALARTEAIAEVALRGVRGLPPDRIPRAPSG
jgi:vancomycin permeability regulator SanA